MLISVPYAALPQVGKELADLITGKTEFDTGNPVARHESAMAAEARATGSGITSPLGPGS